MRVESSEVFFGRAIEQLDWIGWRPGPSTAAGQSHTLHVAIRNALGADPERALVDFVEWDVLEAATAAIHVGLAYGAVKAHGYTGNVIGWSLQPDRTASEIRSVLEAAREGASEVAVPDQIRVRPAIKGVPGVTGWRPVLCGMAVAAAAARGSVDEAVDAVKKDLPSVTNSEFLTALDQLVGADAPRGDLSLARALSMTWVRLFERTARFGRVLATLRSMSITGPRSDSVMRGRLTDLLETAQRRGTGVDLSESILQ